MGDTVKFYYIYPEDERKADEAWQSYAKTVYYSHGAAGVAMEVKSAFINGYIMGRKDKGDE